MTKITVTVAPGYQPPPPPAEPDVVTITVPRPVATAITTFLNYSPTVEVFNELADSGTRPYQWEGTPAHELYNALRQAGVHSRYNEYRDGTPGGYGFSLLSRINVPKGS